MVSKKRGSTTTPETPQQAEQQGQATPTLASPDRVQQMLDDALADSFPASDPVSIVTSQREEAWDAERDGPERPRR